MASEAESLTVTGRASETRGGYMNVLWVIVLLFLVLVLFQSV